MPMFAARHLCPQAVVLPPNMQKYARVGRDVRTLLLKLSPAVENHQQPASPVQLTTFPLESLAGEARIQIGRAHV